MVRDLFRLQFLFLMNRILYTDKNIHNPFQIVKIDQFKIRKKERIPLAFRRNNL